MTPPRIVSTGASPYGIKGTGEASSMKLTAPSLPLLIFSLCSTYDSSCFWESLSNVSQNGYILFETLPMACNAIVVCYCTSVAVVTTLNMFTSCENVVFCLLFELFTVMVPEPSATSSDIFIVRDLPGTSRKYLGMIGTEHKKNMQTACLNGAAPMEYFLAVTQISSTRLYESQYWNRNSMVVQKISFNLYPQKK